MNEFYILSKYMPFDFIITIYKSLLNSLQSQGVSFYTFKDFIENNPGNAIILRHDVDLLPANSYKFAQIQHNLGIRSTFYFRIVPKSYNEVIINQIKDLGHEIGYHYETMDTSNGDLDKAYNEFCRNLEKFRKLYPVETICMHGSPGSKFDNRDIWKKYDYRKLGIVGEPYFDLDFNNVFYLTDTGRCWDGDKYSVRDKVLITNNVFKQIKFHKTQEIIDAIDSNVFPDTAMFTFHPQRWSNNSFLWTKELVWQTIKNKIKKHLIIK